MNRDFSIQSEWEHSVCSIFAIVALPPMMSDADKDNGNSPRAGGHQWPAAAHAGGRHHVAAYISRAAASQLPAFLLGPACLADRHVDATDGDELVRLPNHEFEIFARPRGCHRFCADGVVVGLGRRARRSLPETLHSRGDTIGANGVCIFARHRCVAGIRLAMVRHDHRRAQRNFDGF